MSAQPPQQPTFNIEKIYVKDVSLEIPHAPQIFTESVQPELSVQLNTGSSGIGDGLFEVTVGATVTAKAGERTVFLAEVVQAGIFALRNIPEQEIEPLLGIGCPTIVFPYLRETVSDLVVRGGFPPVLLGPVSFESLYIQRAQQQDGSRIEVAR